MHSTNYSDTFIEIAEDCPVAVAEVPPEKCENMSIASLQHRMISAAPYQYTSDDVIFTIYADRSEIAEADRAAERERFFSKGQACLRSSPLAKRYGWGIHHDADGRVTLVPAGSNDYRRLASDSNVRHVKAMRSKRG